MIKSLRRIGAIAQKEFTQLSRDRTTFAMIVMIPLIQLMLFGYAINSDVRNIPIAIVDLSNSIAARVITEEVRVTQVIEIVAHYDTPAEAEAAIVAGKIRAALVFPENLPQRVAGGTTVAQWMIDGSDTMVSAALLPLRSMPLNLEYGTPPGSYRKSSPTFEMVLFFNPERRSAVNIVPGLSAVILTMTMILFTSAALVREREQGNLELLITTPIRPIELMVGKLIPYVLVGIIQVTIILGLGRIIFNVPFEGALINLAIVTLSFISASLALGLLISTIARTQLQAMQMTIFILLPSILLSGFMFPYEAMPKLAQTLSEALPATHFIRLIRGVVLRGATAPDLSDDIIWLLGFTAIILFISAKRFNKTLD
jgi:ABC-2 type transport system permease protein